jgi:hypothetical protein
MTTPNVENHWIENRILQVGRTYCMVVGFLSVCAIALGFCAVGGSGAYWLFGMPPPPKPVPALAPPAVLTLALARESMESRFVFDDASGSAFDVTDRDVTQVTPLRPLFPDTQFTWDDVYEEYCRSPSSYGCLEKGRKLTRRGVGRFLAFVLGQVERGQRESLLADLQLVLKDAPVADRANLVLATYFAGIKLREANQKAKQDHDDLVEERARAHERALSEHHATALMALTFGGGSVVGGLAAMLSISLIVALLAIERHVKSRPEVA